MCNWPPDLLLMEDYDGIWDNYLQAVYDRFCRDVVDNPVYFQNKRVSVRRHPATNGKGFGFWHCISEGTPTRLENDRVPDSERCQHIGWIRAIIENHPDSNIQYWQNRRGRELNHLLWFRREYLVVLAERRNRSQGETYFLLKTAYMTTRRHRVRKLQQECDQWNDNS